jgi:phage repressor protein C with HTH and peptisase S24 domain
MNQVDFANKLGIKQSPLSQMESGRILPSIETLSTIIRIFNIDYSWLIDGKVEKQNVKEMSPIKMGTNLGTFSEETKSAKNVTLLQESNMPKVVTVDKQGNDNVVLVPVKAAAGYLLGFGDSKYIKSLPTFNLPNIQNGTFRMFQVSGHSMYPTISDGSYVVGEWVENLVKDVKDNRIYVVVSEEGILVKRVLNRLKKYGNLYLKSDNRKEYPNISLEPEQIKEVWSVKMHLSFELPDPAILYDRVSDLEAEMEHLKQQLNK